MFIACNVCSMDTQKHQYKFNEGQKKLYENNNKIEIFP